VREDQAVKFNKLRRLLQNMDGAVVAFSGGIDSTLLLKAAVDALGDRAMAVTATSPIHHRRETEEAKKLARGIGARHQLLQFDALGNEEVAANPPDRCYHCKRALFSKLTGIARAEGLEAVIDGSNVDDSGDYRPGEKALRELGVRSPLREVEFTKADIEDISRELGLPTAGKPSDACLATRVPYGERLTEERLRRIEAAEGLLQELDLRRVRVRDHGAVARIEVSPDDFDALLSSAIRRKIVAGLQRLGYQYVTLDLEGYRIGSMNAGLRERHADPTSGEETMG